MSDELKARILDGAAQAFGKLGYNDVRVEDIIEAAGVSRPTFYKVHASKDDVFQALSVRHHVEIRRRIHDAVAAAGSEPSAELIAMVDAFMRWRAGLGPIGRVLDLQARTPGTTIAQHRAETLRAMTRLSAERMQAAGRPPVDPLMTTALISAMESIADALLLKPTANSAALDRAINLALRIVGAALSNPGDVVPPIPGPPAD